MYIHVLSPDKEFFKGEIKSVKVPGVSGQFEVLQNHAPIVSALSSGPVYIKKENGEKLIFTIRKGFIEVLANEVSLLVQGIDTGA
jgi:F-type H+-transporting ATPase subunit epsilon